MSVVVPSRQSKRMRTRGSALVLLAFIIPVLLVVSAFTINVVYMELVRTELQISTDVATRAAGRMLAVTGDQDRAFEAANQFATLNKVGGQPFSLQRQDLEFGVSVRSHESERYSFSDGANPNAVRLQTESFAVSERGGVPMIFPAMGVPIQFRPIKAAISTLAELDIALVLDRSSSMAFGNYESSRKYPPGTGPAGWNRGDPVPSNSRWIDAVASVKTFLGILTESCLDERVSLQTYSEKPITDVKLTNQYSVIEAGLKDHSRQYDGGRTDIGGGILKAVAALGDKSRARSWASRVIILISDGIHETGTDPIAAAKHAADQQVMIFTVSYSTEANQSLLKQIADIGHGKHLHASTSTDLSNAFEEISKSLPTLITF
jgi:Ca-activated chloride channel family protein